MNSLAAAGWGGRAAMLTVLKSSFVTGLGTKPLTVALNASAGSVWAYGRPGRKAMILSLASL